MRARYPFLVKRDGENYAAKHYTSFENKYIVYDGEYMVFDSLMEMINEYKETQNKHWFEVIPNGVKQRFKFDIDINLCQPNIIIDKQTFLDIFTTAIIQTFKEQYKKDIEYDDLFITSSHSSEKTSFHIIIIPYGVINVYESLKFCESVITNIPPEYKPFIDLSVYKPNQQFRMLYSSKVNSDRIKLPVNHNLPFETSLLLSLIRSENIEIVDELYKHNTTTKVDITDETVVKVNNLMEELGYLQYFRFSHLAGQYIHYLRIRKSYCPVHDKDHDHENIYVTTHNSSVYYNCRRRYANEITSKWIGNIITDDITPIETIETYIKALPTNTLIKKCKPIKYESSGTIYNEPTLRPYPLTKTLVISAQMKMGKTKNLKKFIDEYFQNSSIDIPIIRFISARMTFSNSLKKAFNDFELYSEIDDPTITANKHPRVIIQVESLHRLYEKDEVDLLILDEVESIFEQFNSPLHKNISQTFAIFEKIMRDSKHVICMDANISDRTYNTMQTLREIGDFVQNTYSKASDDIYHITDSINIWYNNLEKFILNGSRIIIPTNSLKEAETCNGLIESFCTKNNLHPNIMMYTSKTSSTTKNIHFEDVNTHWKNYDIIIYTPTMSAGVSFEEEHFDVLFGYFNNNSCTVETCRQMLGRARTVKLFYLCLKSQYKACYPTDINVIKSLIYSNRLSLFDNTIPPMYISYDTKGNKTYNENNYAKLWFENTRMENISKNNFVLKFIDQIHDSGATVNEMITVDNTFMKENRNAVKQEITEYKANIISTARDLKDDEVALIRSKIKNQIEITDDERNSLEKHNLMKLYKKTEIDSNFVMKYNKESVKHVYKNLSDIYSEDTIEQSLEIIRLRELSYYTQAESDIQNENRDLQRNSNYKYHKHKLALYLLSICDLTIDKSKCIYFIRLVDRFIWNGRYLHENKKLISSISEKNYDIITHYQKYLSSGNHTEYILYILKNIINPVLQNMYGLTIKKQPNGIYCIESTNTGKLILSKTKKHTMLDELLEMYMEYLMVEIPFDYSE
jgi:hypothetical protein